MDRHEDSACNGPHEAATPGSGAAWWLAPALVLSTAGCTSSPVLSIDAVPPFSYDDAEQVVIALVACVPGPLTPATGVSNVTSGEIVGLLRGQGSRTVIITAGDVRCIVTAGSDCTAVRACVGLSIDVSAPTCTSSSSTCSGDMVTGCNVAMTSTTPAYNWSLDCARRGLTCLQSSPTSPGACGPRPCLMRNTTTCDGDIRLHVCDTTTTPEPCQIGTTCMAFDGLHGCYGSPCTFTGCAGDTLQYCDGSGRVIEVVPCDAWGQQCVSATLSCGPVSTTCVPGDPSMCLAGQVRYCGPTGDYRGYDCAAHGFGPCETEPGRGVRCAPTGVRLD